MKPEIVDSDIWEVVEISDSQYEKLVTKFGQVEANLWVEKLYLWLKTTRKRRSSHYHCVLAWALKERTIQAKSQVSSGLQLGENHEHVCSACGANPHKWNCYGFDHDKFPCGLQRTAACAKYFERLDAKKRQKVMEF